MINYETLVVNDTLYSMRQKYKLIVHQGGTYSGKTFGILVAIALYLSLEKSKKLSVRIVGQSVPELEAGAYKDWQTINDLVPFAFMESKQGKIWSINGHIIKFTSVDKLGKAKSGKWDITYINEANHIPWDIAEQLLLKSDIKIIDFNPTGPFWFHKQIKPRLEIFKPYLLRRTTYKDNPTLSEDKIKEIESIIDPFKRSAYVLGEMAVNEGIIYPNNETYIGDLPNGSYHFYHLDFGFANDVTALGEVCLYGGEIYCRELIYETGLLTKDLNNLMMKTQVSKKIPIIADNIPKEIAELAAYGWKIIPASKPAGSVNAGISILRNYKIKYHASSINYGEELSTYQYIKDKQTGQYTNVPMDKNNHLLDGLRYWAYTNLKPTSRALQKAMYIENLM